MIFIFSSKSCLKALPQVNIVLPVAFVALSIVALVGEHPSVPVWAITPDLNPQMN